MYISFLSSMCHKFINILACLLWLVPHIYIKTALNIATCGIILEYRNLHWEPLAVTVMCSVISKEHTYHNFVPSKWFWNHRVIYKLRSRLFSVISKEVQISKFHFFIPNCSLNILSYLMAPYLSLYVQT